jgi:voltage-gated potassium channel
MPARTTQTAVNLRLYQLLEKAGTGDRASWWVDILLSAIIIINLTAVCLETVETIYLAYKPVFWWIETLSVSLFSLEYILRIKAASAVTEFEKISSLRARMRYILSPTGVIDLIAILPSLLPLIFGGVDLRWLRVLRLARLFKLSHYTSALEDLGAAIIHERRSFLATLYLLVLAVMVSSTAIYLFEQDLQPEYFGSIPQSMWWSFITLTTVGYGDVVPMTIAGRVIAGMTALMGVCVVALLTGIVASGFSNQMTKKRNIMETEVRRALADGQITDAETREINRLSRELNMEEDDVIAIIERLRSMNQQK